MVLFFIPFAPLLLHGFLESLFFSLSRIIPSRLASAGSSGFQDSLRSSVFFSAFFFLMLVAIAPLGRGAAAQNQCCGSEEQGDNADDADEVLARRQRQGSGADRQVAAWFDVARAVFPQKANRNKASISPLGVLGLLGLLSLLGLAASC